MAFAKKNFDKEKKQKECTTTHTKTPTPEVSRLTGRDAPAKRGGGKEVKEENGVRQNQRVGSFPEAFGQLQKIKERKKGRAPAVSILK